MDSYEIAKNIVSRVNTEDLTEFDPNSTGTTYATARNDSADGLVNIYIPGTGDTLEDVSTDVACTEGDNLLVNITGRTPRVVGNKGQGDQLEDSVVQAGKIYQVVPNSPIIESYPDGTVVPTTISAISYVKASNSSPNVLYADTLRLRASANGTSWTDITSSTTSSISAQAATIEARVPKFKVVQIRLFDSSGTQLASTTIQRSEEAPNYVTKNDSGLYVHEVEGEQNFSTGSNLRMQSDEIQIREDGTVLASFRSDAIELGKDTPLEANVDISNGAIILGAYTEGDYVRSSIRTPQWTEISAARNRGASQQLEGSILLNPLNTNSQARAQLMASQGVLLDPEITPNAGISSFASAAASNSVIFGNRIDLRTQRVRAADKNSLTPTYRDVMQFCCATGSPTSQAVTANQFSIVTMNTLVAQSSAPFALGGQGIRVPYAGVILVSASLYHNPSTTEANKGVYIFKGVNSASAVEQYGEMKYFPANFSGCVSVAQKAIPVAANDIIYLRSRSTVTGTIAPSQPHSFLTVQYV